MSGATATMKGKTVIAAAVCLCMDFLADARAVIDAGPVCESCLGRVFADRSFGLSNADRGTGARTAVALADDEPYESVAPPTAGFVTASAGGSMSGPTGRSRPSAPSTLRPIRSAPEPHR